MNIGEEDEPISVPAPPPRREEPVPEPEPVQEPEPPIRQEQPSEQG